MIDQTRAKRINADLAAAVDSALKMHGLQRTRISLRYEAAGTIKVTLEANEVGTDRRELALDTYADRYGIPRGSLGALFLSGGNVFELVGLEPKNRRYPIIAKKHADGKTYKLPASVAVIDQLRNPAPELAR